MNDRVSRRKRKPTTERHRLRHRSLKRELIETPKEPLKKKERTDFWYLQRLLLIVAITIVVLAILLQLALENL